MKIYYVLLCVALLSLTTTSCRQDDDYITSFAGEDNIIIDNASSSFAKEFEALWTAINCNYAAWEIETVNWDDVYNIYRPRFVELDTLMARGEVITDQQFTELYHQVLDTLHDGHSSYSIKNLSTGGYIYIYPQQERNARRFKNPKVEVPYDIDYYCSDNVPEGERFLQTPVCALSCKDAIVKNLTKGLENIEKALLSATEEETIGRLMQEKMYIEDAFSRVPSCPLLQEQTLIDYYNNMASVFHDALMPLYQTNIVGINRFRMMSAISNDGIAYLRFSNFMMSAFFNMSEEDKAKYTADDIAQINRIHDVWQYWFDGIQQLSAQGKLRGVVIDVRGNGGGIVNDHQYVLGAMLPSGGYKAGTYKMKNGTGRLDYSVDFDYIIHTMEGEHAIVSDVPIVALCDHVSLSCAEITSQCVKQQPNGIVIGSQTFGGMSILTMGAENYSLNYSGEFGVQGKTPIYGFQPYTLINFTGGGVLEGIGVTPSEGYDIEYDHGYVSTQINSETGMPYQLDNQLEAALKYIRTR